MNPEDRIVKASGYCQVIIHVNVELDENELADLMDCEVHELLDKDEDEIETKLVEHATMKWEDYIYQSEVYDYNTHLSIEDETPEEEEIQEDEKVMS